MQTDTCDASELNPLAMTKLKREKVFWTKLHPLGFMARPFVSPDGQENLRRWRVGIPGRAGTPWEHGFYRLYVTFGAYYPLYPPQCCFVRAPYHPNVSPQGTFKLPLLTYGGGWKQDTTLEAILLAIQDMIHNPVFNNALQQLPYLEWREAIYIDQEKIESIGMAKLRFEKAFWLRPHPYGFIATPIVTETGEYDLRRWIVGVPGRDGTPWENGFYCLLMRFGRDFPLHPPECVFVQAPYHPNVSLQGAFTLPLLTFGADWKANTSIETILLAVQDMLHNPDFSRSVQSAPYNDWRESVDLFLARVQDEASWRFFTRFRFYFNFFD